VAASFVADVSFTVASVNGATFGSDAHPVDTDTDTATATATSSTLGDHDRRTKSWFRMGLPPLSKLPND
jgi:hypothetical protein